MLKCVVLVIFSSVVVKCQVNLEQHFGHCRVSTDYFDECVKNGLNELNPYFKEGLPDYGIGSFDPFYAAEIPHKMRTPFFEYRLVLRNVSEHGWTAAEITKLKTDFDRQQVAITQSFPDKRLKGLYEIDGTFFGQKVRNSGSWSLSLFDYTQTLTISRRSSKNSILYLNPPIEVKCNIHTCQKLELHIENLARGRTIVENILDRIINTFWPPGFIVLSPIINDLVSTAFTEILNKYFQNFPFEAVFKR